MNNKNVALRTNRSVYEPPLIETISLSDLDIISTSDENQGEWDPQLANL